MTTTRGISPDEGTKVSVCCQSAGHTGTMAIDQAGSQLARSIRRSSTVVSGETVTNSLSRAKATRVGPCNQPLRTRAELVRLPEPAKDITYPNRSNVLCLLWDLEHGSNTMASDQSTKGTMEPSEMASKREGENPSKGGADATGSPNQNIAIARRPNSDL